MLHDFLLHTYNTLHFYADGDAPSSDGLKTAIVVTAGTVISAGFAALAIIVPKHRDSQAPPAPPVPVPGSSVTPPRPESTGTDDRFVTFLRDEIARLQAKADEDDRIASGQATMIERLRDFCWNNHLNPLQFRKMRQGETRENSVSP